MVGIRWPKQICFLSVFVGLGNALLTGRLRAPCSNSDGLAGYDFSHKGLWIPGYHLLGTGFSKQSCSVECSKRRDCVAFSGAFMEDGGNGGCYTYAATGGRVPASTDRAYKKCSGSLPPLPELPKGVTQFVVNRQSELLTMAEGMEKQLDAVSQTINAAHVRMRRLKSMVAGAANILINTSQLASATAQTALGNRGGLEAIARNKRFINMTFTTINGSSTRMQTLLKRIKERADGAATGTEEGKGGKSPGALMKALQPNVTALEKKLNQLNDPATTAQINGLVTSYDKFTGRITSTVKSVLSNNHRGLVNNMRDAMYNYTTALQNHKKDPCCCK